jgi:hypothetical protein
MGLALTISTTARRQPMSGHSNFKTTQAYIDLPGETFRAEAELLEQRLFGANAQTDSLSTARRLVTPDTV